MKINKTHRDVMRMLLEGKLSIGEIAERVKKSRRTVQYWMKDEDFKAEFEELKSDYERTIKARTVYMAKTALDTQENIMLKSKNAMARASVSADVLDRAGFIKLKQSDMAKAEADSVEGGIVILADVIGEGGEDDG